MTIIGTGLPPISLESARYYQAAGINPSGILAANDPSILAYQHTPYSLPQYLATDFMNLNPGFDELLNMGNVEAMEANFNLQAQAYQNYLRTGVYGVDPFVVANVYTKTLNGAANQVQSLAKQTATAAGSMFDALEQAVKSMAPDN